MPAYFKHGEKQFYCDAFCYMRWAIDAEVVYKPMRWRDIINFYLTLPEKYPPAEWPDKFREYKYLADLDPEVTMEAHSAEDGADISAYEKFLKTYPHA